jgi:hypothetical protein
MTRLVLGVVALFTLGCTGFGVLVYDRDDTTDTDTGPDLPLPDTGGGTYPRDTGAPPPRDDFPARYLGIRAQFAYSRPNNKVMTGLVYGAAYPSKISIELYTENFLQFGMDYADTDEYCTIDLLLRPGNPQSSQLAQADETAYTAFAHSGAPAETTSTCGDAQHPVDGLFYGDPVQTVLGVSGLPWAVGVGDLTTDYGYAGEGTIAGGRIYNAGALTGEAIPDDAFLTTAYAIDPNTGELLLDENYNATALLATEMWNGTKLASGLYLVNSGPIIDLGADF